MNNKIKKALGVILIGIVALIFIGGGLYNISGAPATVEIAKGVGGIRNLIVLGTLEIVFGILFLIPRTGVLGALLLIAYMGGAMAFHLAKGTSLIIPSVIQIIVWIASFVRFTEFGQRLTGDQFFLTSLKSRQ